jgi:hypothetical protein
MVFLFISSKMPRVVFYSYSFFIDYVKNDNDFPRYVREFRTAYDVSLSACDEELKNFNEHSKKIYYISQNLDILYASELYRRVKYVMENDKIYFHKIYYEYKEYYTCSNYIHGEYLLENCFVPEIRCHELKLPYIIDYINSYCNPHYRDEQRKRIEREQKEKKEIEAGIYDRLTVNFDEDDEFLNKF